jgi:hypothetical protein
MVPNESTDFDPRPRFKVIPAWPGGLAPVNAPSPKTVCHCLLASSVKHLRVVNLNTVRTTVEIAALLSPSTTPSPRPTSAPASMLHFSSHNTALPHGSVTCPFCRQIPLPTSPSQIRDTNVYFLRLARRFQAAIAEPIRQIHDTATRALGQLLRGLKHRVSQALRSSLEILQQHALVRQKLPQKGLHDVTPGLRVILVAKPVLYFRESRLSLP